MMEFAINTTPITEILHHPGVQQDIRLYLKRDDLIHPQIQGNKWRKLHLLLQDVKQRKIPGILSFGGPFSNHLHALAAAGQSFGIQTVGILRGLSVDLENPTLKFARTCGMQCFPVGKKIYDLGIEVPEIQQIIKEFPGFEILPEGGSTVLGLLGCKGIGTEIATFLGDRAQVYISVPAGTGCTAAGTIAGLQGKGQILVFPAAPYGLDAEKIKHYCALAQVPVYENFRMETDYLFGGFADLPPTLIRFIHDFRQSTGILLDPIYTSKMMFGLFDLMTKGYFPAGSTIVAVHTGGLQGWDGFRARLGDVLIDL